MWKPINKKTPNDTTILVAYDNGDIELVKDEDNSFNWTPHDGHVMRGLAKPMYWMIPPKPPRLPVGESASE